MNGLVEKFAFFGDGNQLKFDFSTADLFDSGGLGTDKVFSDLSGGELFTAENIIEVEMIPITEVVPDTCCNGTLTLDMDFLAPIFLASEPAMRFTC